MSQRPTAPPPLADAATTDTRFDRRRRWLAGALSVTAHLLVFAGLLWVAPSPPREPEPEPMIASVVDLPKPEPKPPAPPSPKPTPPKAGGHHSAVRLAKAPRVDPVLAAAKTPKPDTSDLLSNSQIAGAASAGEGGGGGGGSCDLAQAVQRALRRDPLVQSAVFQAHRSGKAIMVWNGDWVKNGDQDGKGLSAVREAITWEVAFAPESCRKEEMHGLILLSLADGSTRFAVGGGDWRWSDLLHVRGLIVDR
ncbi:MAG TPA: hypothetical protein VMU59_13805 [Caulobacteraceae bacterium]|nr:hypothetical protein [Caulobacteraceae bacterium]